jgi:hypothetical protein
MLQRRLDLMRTERLVKTAPRTRGSDTLLCICIDICGHEYHRNSSSGVYLLRGLDSIHIALQADIHQHYIGMQRQRFLNRLHPRGSQGYDCMPQPCQAPLEVHGDKAFIFHNENTGCSHILHPEPIPGDSCPV